MTKFLSVLLTSMSPTKEHSALITSDPALLDLGAHTGGTCSDPLHRGTQRET